MTFRTIGTGIVLVAVAATIAACDPMRDARQSVATSAAEATTLVDRARVPTPPVDRRTVTFSDQVWLGQRSFIDRSGDALPARFEGDDGFLLATFGAPLTIDDLANEIRTQTGINVVIEQGTVDSEDEAPTAFPIDYEGPLSDFLDGISTSFGASWDYRRGRITLYLEETQTFEVTALPTESEVTQSSTAETAGDGAGVSTSFESSQTASTAAWEDLQSSLETLLNERGTVSVAPAFGSVTVTAVPSLMRRVEEFIETLNRRALRQVALTVKLVEVSLIEGDVTNFDLQLAFQRAASLVTPGVVATDPLVTTTNLGQIVAGGTAAAPTFSTTGDLSFIINGNNRFSGTELGIQTLRELGETSLINEASVSTLSGRAVPVNVVFQQSYIAETTVTTEEGVTTTEFEVENAVDGININLLPSVLNDGRVLTQVAVALRGEPTFVNVAAGGNSIQLLQQDLRDFQQQIVLNSGDAFVAAGFRAVDNSFNQRGFPGLGLLLGGTQSGINQNTLIALIISPQVLSQRRVAQR